MQRLESFVWPTKEEVKSPTKQASSRDETDEKLNIVATSVHWEKRADGLEYPVWTTPTETKK